VPSVHIPVIGPPATAMKCRSSTDAMRRCIRAQLLPRALSSLRRLCLCSASYDRITKMGIGIADRRTDGADDGYARAWTEETVRRSRSWSGARANDGGPCTIRERRGGQGFLILSKQWGRGVVGGDMRGTGRQLKREDAEALASRLGAFARRRLGDVVELEPPLQHIPGAIRGGCWPHALRCVSWAGAVPTRAPWRVARRLHCAAQ
jgi:hypothetical protein